MRYEVCLERAAQRDLKKLSPEVFRRVVSHIQELARDPHPKGCRKIVGSENSWRIRVGDYRIVYEISEEDKTVRVMYVRHRREAYRE